MNYTLRCLMLVATALLACSQLSLAAPQNSIPNNETEPAAPEVHRSYPDAPSVVKRRREVPRPAAKNGALHAADRKYMALLGTMLAFSVVDAEETNKCFEAHTCAFLPVLLRSRGALYGAGLPAAAGVAYLSYKLKDHGHRWWFVPFIVITAANIRVAYHAAHEPSRSKAQ